MFNYPPSQSLPFQDAFLSQYQTNAKICSQYIKIASGQLYLEEARRISQANDLLEKLSTRERVKDLSEWDVFTTRDSVMLEDLSISNQNMSINLGNVTTERGRVLTRRSALGSRTSRDSEGSIGEAVAEVERVCSPKNANLVRRLLEDYRKLKGRVAESEKKEKAARHMQRLIEDLQQKNIILAQRVEEIECEVDRLRGENGHLRQENRELNEVLFQKMNEINSEKKIRLFEEIASHRSAAAADQAHYSAIQIVAQVVQEKQAIIAMRCETARQIESRVEELLFSGEQACSDCCGMLRKLKQSILNYKAYLQQEGAQFEAMFDAFKQNVEVLACTSE